MYLSLYAQHTYSLYHICVFPSFQNPWIPHNKPIKRALLQGVVWFWVGVVRTPYGRNLSVVLRHVCASFPPACSWHSSALELRLNKYIKSDSTLLSKVSRAGPMSVAAGSHESKLPPIELTSWEMKVCTARCVCLCELGGWRWGWGG